ncbi:hypothetical protein BH11PSE3_BH11PSE3_25910 [soil metagenome]
MMQILTYVSIFLLSVVVPLGIFIGRDGVRSTRGRLVDELANLFSFAREQDGSPLIVPSFELVKYKYDVARDPIQRRSWLVPVSIYVVLTFLGFMTAFANLRTLGLADIHNAFLEAGKPNVKIEKVEEIIGIISYAFLGGYLWTIQYLIRRVANFDLKPLSFLRCSIHILFGIFVSAAAWHASEPVAGTQLTMAAPLAFLIGMSPTLMVEKLMARFSFMQLRRVKNAAKALCEEVPLDTVLGIDPYIKFRLAEFEIEDVQNLATTNPIQLFVETPYGLYEAIDWVAQAQLILAVGATKTKQLREINIRTIFDLEKALFNTAFSGRLLSILVPDLTSAEATAPANGTLAGVGHLPMIPWWDGHLRHGTSEIDLDYRDFLQALVGLLRDDLHVLRLRQIWDVIRDQLVKRPHIAGA